MDKDNLMNSFRERELQRKEESKNDQSQKARGRDKGNAIRPASGATSNKMVENIIKSRLKQGEELKNKTHAERINPEKASAAPTNQEAKKVTQKTQEPQTRQQPTGDQVKAQEQLRQAQSKNLMSQKIAAQRQVQGIPKPEPTKEQPVKQPVQKTTQSRMTQNLQKEANAIKKDTPLKATVVKKAPAKTPPIKGK